MISKLAKKERLTKSDITHLSKKILEFCQELCDFRLYKYQKEAALRIIKSILSEDCAEITLLWARQSGKSTTVALVITGLLFILPYLASFFKDERITKFRNGFWACNVAPTHDQAVIIRKVKAFLKQEVTRKILELEFGIKINPDKISLEFPNGSRLHELSSAKQSRIVSHTFHFVAIDEAQEISKEKIDFEIRPFAAATAGSFVFLGTCTTYPCEFKQIIKRNVKKELETGDKLHFEFNETVISKYNKRWAKFVEEERRRLGYDSDGYKLAYRLIWLDSEGMFVPEDIFKSCGENYDIIYTDYERPVLIGIDVGGQVDSTVATAVAVDMTQVTSIGDYDRRYKKYILNWLELKGVNYEAQYQMLADFVSKYNTMYVLVDASGKIGDPFFERLKNILRSVSHAKVLPIVLNLQNKHKIFTFLREEFMAKRIAYPAGEATQQTQEYKKFIEQITNVEITYHGKYFNPGHKDRKHNIYHDDYFMSLGLAVWGEKELKYGYVKVSDNIIWMGRKIKNPIISGFNKYKLRG